MNLDSALHNDPFEEMETYIQQKYLELMRLRLELSKMIAAKSPDAENLAIVIGQRQEEFEGITKTHKSYQNVAKQFLGNRKSKPNTETQEEFNKLISEMKSSTMGSIVTGIPKS